MYFTNIELGYKLAVVPKLFVPRCYGHCFEKISQMFPGSYIPCRFIELFPSSDTLQPFLPVVVSRTWSHRRKFLELHRVIPSRFLRRFSYFSRASLPSVFFLRAYISEKRKISKFQTSVRIIHGSRVYFLFLNSLSFAECYVHSPSNSIRKVIEKFKEFIHTLEPRYTLTYTCFCSNLN